MKKFIDKLIPFIDKLIPFIDKLIPFIDKLIPFVASRITRIISSHPIYKYKYIYDLRLEQLHNRRTT